MSPEGAPKQEKKEKKLSGALEIGFLATALLAAHPEAQALEMAPHTDWTTGIQRNVRESVLKEKIEHAVVYIQFTDGTGTWLPVVRGEKMRVNVNLLEEHEELEGARGQRQVQKMCMLHTHPSEAHRDGLGEKSLQSLNPPSPGDIRGALISGAYYAKFGAGEHNLTHLVADSQGIWYYAHDGSPQRREAVVTMGNLRTSEKGKLWNRSFDDFVLASTDRMFNFKQEFPALKQAYKQHLSANIRFVPYSAVPKESACAGVDYKPVQKTTPRGPAGAVQ